MESKSRAHEQGRSSRRRYTPKQISEYLAAQRRSGLTIAAFCQQQGFHPSVFYGWKRRQGDPARVVSTFREVSLPALMGSTWVAEIAMSSGSVLRLSAQTDWASLQPWLSKLLRS
jgi:hypothetical protein